MKALKFIPLVVLLVLSACASSQNSGSSGAWAGLAGVWQDPETGTEHTIVRDGSGFKVVSAIDDDGEVFRIVGSTWGDDVLTWTYFVPSTGYTVVFTTATLSGNELHCKWANQHTSGYETLRRVR